jgi:hypothetical protein
MHGQSEGPFYQRLSEVGRDDFDEKTKEILARRVGYRCSNPNCRQLTSGPQTNPAKAINIGVAAHTIAASSGGPRYDASMSSEERRSPENGIWLCQNCAKLIDNDESRYTIDLLQEWKRLSERAALLEIEIHRSPQRQPMVMTLPSFASTLNVLIARPFKTLSGKRAQWKCLIRPLKTQLLP